MIHIPYRTSFPDPSFTVIHIIDSATGEPIENGEVAYALAKFKNWVPPSTFAKCSLTDQSPRKRADSPEDSKSYWFGQETDKGTFQLARKKRWSWYHVTFPVGFPLGIGLFNTYDGLLLVSAPGYRTMVISDSFGRLHQRHTPEQWQAIGMKVRDMTGSYAEIKKRETEVALIKKLDELNQK